MFGDGLDGVIVTRLEPPSHPIAHPDDRQRRHTIVDGSQLARGNALCDDRSHDRQRLSATV
jgi:hypothetical protein